MTQVDGSGVAVGGLSCWPSDGGDVVVVGVLEDVDVDVGVEVSESLGATSLSIAGPMLGW